ncbi:FAD-dependent oxidoreductase [Streptomyces phaeochromogenes]|uniref:FAD-dependent oxidoreductase n=1 Tax=Streptomyces phaeochromogenes TaxID=1923 RepID=A0ABZ1HM63_STRPH|nr:FAD-dependent oxidoreductase [Streptomyces phaeochromogenes]WSD19695.1 FAD-dependent oxidoreductase [Streptomyces phaeochromogenes]
MSTVIVGAGQAGAQVAATLRKEGYDKPITLIGNEPEPPYHRPPLSKAFLLGPAGETALHLRDESFYRDNTIELRLGTWVTGIDRTAQKVRLTGEALAYEHLVLATGARPRPLAVPGADLGGVLPLRSLSDARELRARMTSARSVVMVGGGFIGLEFAAVAASEGREVTLLEAADRLMGRPVTEQVSRYFADAHAERGVRVRLGTGAVELLGRRGEVTGVRATDGQIHAADLVVTGVGVVPNSELGEQAGLAVDNGILVDAGLRTADPRIHAIGDCARFPSAHLAAPVRLESVQNAVDQAAHTGRRIATGEARTYRELPWFWSDQKGIRLQIAGLSTGYDQVHLLGDPADGRFSALAFRAGRLVAVESVGRPAEHLAARRLLSSEIELTPVRAAAPDFDLKTFAADTAGLTA